MVSSDLQRVHQRIDALGDEMRADVAKLTSEVGALKGAVLESIAKCDLCRPLVMGNGMEPLPVRVARLEESRSVVRWGTGKIIAICGIIATAIAASVHLIAHLIQG
jgi:hypothetical protein